MEFTKEHKELFELTVEAARAQLEGRNVEFDKLENGKWVPSKDGPLSIIASSIWGGDNSDGSLFIRGVPWRIRPSPVPRPLRFEEIPLYAWFRQKGSNNAGKIIETMDQTVRLSNYGWVSPDCLADRFEWSLNYGHATTTKATWHPCTKLERAGS